MVDEVEFHSLTRPTLATSFAQHVVERYLGQEFILLCWMLSKSNRFFRSEIVKSILKTSIVAILPLLSLPVGTASGGREQSLQFLIFKKKKIK